MRSCEGASYHCSIVRSTIIEEQAIVRLCALAPLEQTTEVIPKLVSNNYQILGPKGKSLCADELSLWLQQSS